MAKGHAADVRATGRLSPIVNTAPQVLATATLTLETRGEGFSEITRDVADFLREVAAGEGTLLLYLRHTSASLVIQENADPDVQDDLMTALARLAPQHAGWVHDTEGPDDMPAHIKAMLNGISLNVPVSGGKAALGAWQGVYLVEHREAPHSREVVLNSSEAANKPCFKAFCALRLSGMMANAMRDARDES